MSAVVRHGNCLTIGARGRSLIEHLLAIELRAIGIEPMQLPDGLRRVATGERTIWLNFTETMQRTPAGLPVEPVSWRMEPSRKD
jgi:hypothetical protein